jgi:hypothetical protein
MAVEGSSASRSESDGTGCFDLLEVTAQVLVPSRNISPCDLLLPPLPGKDSHFLDEIAVFPSLLLMCAGTIFNRLWSMRCAPLCSQPSQMEIAQLVQK